MKNLKTYESLERNYDAGNHNRRCIDGTITGCGNCIGYCAYTEHQGYLTKELMRQHDCLGKNCYHYIKKEKSCSQTNAALSSLGQLLTAIPETVMQQVKTLTSDLEGILFTQARILNIGVCELSYITITNDYSIVEIADRLSEITGCKIIMKNLNYSFEHAASLIFGSSSLNLTS